MVAVLGTATFGGFGVESVSAQLGTQAFAVLAVILWSAVASYLIILVCRVVTGLRVSPEDETTGLDQGEHGETAYHFE
jgi:Amt family ammonium transporter